jgi:ankyrin repeat protein
MSDSSDIGHQRLSGPSGEANLSEALRDGDLGRVRTLIEAGADVRYKRDHGYDAVLDAVHGRGMDCNQRLLDLLALLAAHGADLSGVSSYGESGLRVLSRLGRFDAVRLLLDAGADKTQLEWTPLMEAVALGSLADVQVALANGPALEERDWWDRTVWLIALLTGDISKAKLLRERGADPTACGRCGCPPLFFAIQGHHPDLLRWLLREGADVHQTDESGTTALIEAVANDDLDCVEILLNAGANVETNANGTAIGQAQSREIIMRLLAAGADPADANQRVILALRTTADEALAAVTPDEFRRTFAPKFGESNPKRMNNRFWEAMIRCGISAYGALHRFEVSGPVTGPACAGLYTDDRKRTRSRFGGPVWCAQRFGQSLTLLPDGRAVQIGGEHEDYYDPDFCIYNDVFVHGRDGSLAIYGYPQSVFPPTDFHTATLVGSHIYVIGSLGYRGARRPGETPVYRLDIHTLRMEHVDAGGEAPGWIYQHRATAVKAHEIRIWGGTVVTASGSEESRQENAAAFVLDLECLAWRRESILGLES